MEHNNEIKEWSMWIDPVAKIISMKEIANGKKKVFETDRERIEFGAKLVFKGYKIG